MATLLQIMEKISYLQSKLAIEQALLSHVEANFLDSDAGEAEMVLTRPDHGAVPQEHLTQYIEDIAERLDQSESELHEWQHLEVNIEDLEDEDDEVEDEEGEEGEEVEETAEPDKPPAKKSQKKPADPPAKNTKAPKKETKPSKAKAS